MIVIMTQIEFQKSTSDTTINLRHKKSLTIHLMKLMCETELPLQVLNDFLNYKINIQHWTFDCHIS